MASQMPPAQQGVPSLVDSSVEASRPLHCSYLYIIHHYLHSFLEVVHLHEVRVVLITTVAVSWHIISPDPLPPTYFIKFNHYIS